MKVSFNSSMFEISGLVKFGRLYGEDLALSLWWMSLDEKLAVSGIMNLVADMDIYAKREMRLNALGMPFTLFYLS